MDLLQLKYFQKVAKHQHLTKAAYELNVSQPALSKMIAKLEKRLGYQLFDRVGRQIKLNPLGEAYLKVVENVFFELQKGEQELAVLSGKDSNLISVAVTNPTILPELFTSFLTQYPAAKFHQSLARPDHLVQQLRAGEVNIGIITSPIDEEDIEWLPVFEEEIVLAVPASHPLADKKNILLKEVANEAFIALPPAYPLRHLMEAFCIEAGFMPDYAFEGHEMTVAYDLVENGLGVTFGPSIFRSKLLDSPNIVEIRLSEPACTRPVGLVWHKSASLSTPVQQFINHIVKFLKQKQLDHSFK